MSITCRPNNIEDYVHRIGRTGRAGAKGYSVSFFTEKHSKIAKDLIDVLVSAKQDVPPTLQSYVRSGSYGGHPRYGRGGGGGGGRRY